MVRLIWPHHAGSATSTVCVLLGMLALLVILRQCYHSTGLKFFFKCAKIWNSVNSCKWGDVFRVCSVAYYPRRCPGMRCWMPCFLFVVWSGCWTPRFNPTARESFLFQSYVAMRGIIRGCTAANAADAGCVRILPASEYSYACSLRTHNGSMRLQLR